MENPCTELKKGIQDGEWLVKNWRKLKLPLLFIFVFLLGRLSIVFWPNFLNFCNKKAQPISIKEIKLPEEQISRNVNVLPLIDFEKNKNKWDLRAFNLQDDGFYCPREREKYEYYYTWYKERIPLVSSNLFKILTKPYDPTHTTDQGEAVIKLGEKSDSDKEYTELYLPARNKEPVKYKQSIANILQWYPYPGAISTPVKTGKPIEVLSRIIIDKDNFIGTKIWITYISNGSNSNRITDPFTYSNFTIDAIRPEEEMTRIAIGVDKNSCFKIEGYNLNLSSVEVTQILNLY